MYEIDLSPNLITNPVPYFTFYYKRIGSNAGSRFSPTFSKSTHFPNWIAISKPLNRFGSDCLKTSKPVSIFFPKFLINLFAYVYGSIIRGHLLDLNIIIPFSTDNLSEGSPATPHYLIVTSSPKTLLIVIFSDNLIPSSLILSLHVCSNSSL